MSTVHEAILRALVSKNLVIGLLGTKVYPAIWLLINGLNIFLDLFLQVLMGEFLQMIDIGALNLFNSIYNVFFSSLYVMLIAVIVVQELKDPKHLPVDHWAHYSIIDHDWKLLKLTVQVVYFLQ